MDDFPKTYDHVLRDERRLLLRDAALRAEDALGEDSPYRLMVSGSLSRGQVHPWSDLDLVLISVGGGKVEENETLRMETRRRVSDALDMYDADVVYADDVFDGLRKGMMGSLVLASDIPPLADLPELAVVLARIHVSIGYALEGLDRIIADYAASEKKLAVHADDGRSPWLDDSDDDEALDRLLERLSSPGSAPDGVSPVLEAASAGALRYLVVDAYDFVFRRSETECPRRYSLPSVKRSPSWDVIWKPWFQACRPMASRSDERSVPEF